MTEEAIQNINNSLNEILRLLRLLVIPAKSKIKSILEEEYLTTDERSKMLELMDGSQSISDIANEINMSNEAVRQFVRLLSEVGVIEILKIKGKTGYPKSLI